MTAQTDMEKMASSEDPLSKSLNEFDLWQQKKQEKLRDVVASQRSAGSPSRAKEKGGGGSIPSEPGGAKAQSDGSSSKEKGMDTEARMAEAGAALGVEKQVKTSPRGRVVEGGSDDDVVARQLREAAEKERDPVMKEKLWDEYRKYKASMK